MVKNFDSFLNEGHHNSKSSVYVYHHSKHDFRVGQILDSPINKNSEFKQLFEEVFDEYRIKINSSVPSRLKCLFSSPYSYNTFSDFGTKYKCEIIGNYFSTDSRCIDNIHDSFSNTFKKEIQYLDDNEKRNRIKEILNDNYNVQQYWKGKLGDKKDIEILSTQLKVIEKIKCQKYIVVNPFVCAVSIDRMDMKTKKFIETNFHIDRWKDLIEYNSDVLEINKDVIFDIENTFLKILDVNSNLHDDSIKINILELNKLKNCKKVNF